MGGGNPARQESVSRTELPKWVDTASQDIWKKAQGIADKPGDFFQGPRVADVSSSITEAGDMYRRLTDPAGSGLLANFMNPYVDNVENKALEAMDRSRQMALMDNADRAASAGAFGGSRHGIVDAVTNTEHAREAGMLSAGLRREAFDSGMRNALDHTTTAAQGLFGVGTVDQANQQAKIDAEIGKFNEIKNKDLNDLNMLIATLGGTPYGQTSTTTTTGTAESRGTDWASLGLGALSLLFGVSDDDKKTDKERLGETPDGLGIWAFRYKDDPKTYPKSIGVMASEVEKVKPEAVHKIGDTRVINYGLLSGV